jgi:hypothetical protein
LEPNVGPPDRRRFVFNRTILPFQVLHLQGTFASDFALTADVCFLMGPVNSAVNHQSITFIAGIDSSRSSIPTQKSPPRTKSSTRECFRRPELIHPPATLLPPATVLTFPDRPPLSSTDSFSRGFVPPQVRPIFSTAGSNGAATPGAGDLAKLTAPLGVRWCSFLRLAVSFC